MILHTYKKESVPGPLLLIHRNYQFNYLKTERDCKKYHLSEISITTMYPEIIMKIETPETEKYL